MDPEADHPPRPQISMSGLALDPVRSFPAWLSVVFAATLVESAMRLAPPRPLGPVLDDARANRHLPHWYGMLISTIMSDAATVQGFASSSTPGNIVRPATIVLQRGLHLRRKVAGADATQAMGVLGDDLRKAGVTMCNHQFVPAASKPRALVDWPNRSNHAWLGA